MKIGIDVFSFDKPGENYGVGPGVYVWHLLPELFRLGKHHTFVVFANRDNETMIPRLPNVKVVVSKLPNKFRPFRIVHEQVSMVYYALKFKLDLIHFLGNNISFGVARRSVITILDLMWKYYYDRGSRNLKSLYNSIIIPITIKRAKAIITISKFVANQVQEEFNRNERIYPILLAPGKLVQATEQQNRMFAEKYDYDFMYTVTTSMPHKNLITLLKAFAMMRERNAFEGKLIITGQMKGKFHLPNQEFIREHKLEKEVILTGFIPDEEKTYLYKHAKIVVYPSLYEGFGLPVLEAMSVGTPVITSHAASIPEVGGDACLYFNPNSADELAELMISTLSDTSLMTNLKSAGFIQYNRFSWEKVAAETLEVYEKQQ